MNRDAGILPEYAYDLPPELVANEPADPRDSSRLLVADCRTGTVGDRSFSDLSDVVPKGALLVLNETKVIPARIVLEKQSGGRPEILFYVNEWDGASKSIRGLSDRKLSPGDKLFSGAREICVVTKQNESLFSFDLLIAGSEFIALLESSGVMPIPKYIKGTPLSERELKDRYQTTFAKNPGSVAAPTASLHFTDRVFQKLEAKGVRIARLTLHVGAGTFAPITGRELESGKLHTELFTIPDATKQSIALAKQEGRPVIAVGTTALRALESAARGAVSSTDIFIRKPFDFKVADGLITNFHVPRSSLMCLVDAFLAWKGFPQGILALYRHAIKEKYRFFSFGDAMLIL
ncbi:MAG TPA: tRNA preQ1(34) S-adenosylmethionine ribosyltransferase-isomerase QueA [Candidatus Paceibacterota bacterium]|nr:tRNA preQ1(34) S-adenosylmethionine ribosyltransferase-isomerase QueA [Candidatus Paceibacterota bacterium]